MIDEKKRESAIASELKRLAESHGGKLQPKAVVDAARSENSPLHNSFEWDDSEAAEKWRLVQARELIRTVVTFATVGKKLMPVRVFVSLTPDREKNGVGYRLVNAVMSDATHRQQMLADAIAEMVRFKEKYRRLTELTKVFEAMDEVVANESAELSASA